MNYHDFLKNRLITGNVDGGIFNAHPIIMFFRELSEISRGGGGGTEGGHNFLSLRKGRGHEKWAIKRVRVMQIYASDNVEIHPQKKKEVLYLAKNKKRK